MQITILFKHVHELTIYTFSITKTTDKTQKIIQGKLSETLLKVAIFDLFTCVLQGKFKVMNGYVNLVK